MAIKTWKPQSFDQRLVYNKTEELLTCYNNQGTLVELLPDPSDLPDFEFGIVYIVTDEDYRKYKSMGRTGKDFVRVKSRSVGRGSVDIAYLESFEEYDEDHKRVAITPCSIMSYERNDPEGSVHNTLDV